MLARKYRPQRFDQLVGQEHIARTLTNAISAKRVHHAFLFTGARGVGKTSAARILAKALSCVNGPTATPCGACEFCREIATGQSVDVFEIDGASNTGVDDVRALREGVRYMPAKGRRKIYIIDEVHMLSTSAFNALLKTLEEPPEHVVFVFATTEVHKIPATILSRCQRYDFKLIPTAALVDHLTGILAAESIAAEPDAARLVARQAAGSVRDALSLLDQVIAYVGDQTITPEKAAEVLGIADRRLLVDLGQAVLARDAAAALRHIARAADRGVDLGQLARAFLGFLRDLELLMLTKGDAADLVDATADEIAEARALGARAPSGLMGALFDRWARAVDESARSQTPRLLLEMALVDLCQAEPLVPLGDLLERLDDLEAKMSGGGGGRAGDGGGRRGRGGPKATPSNAGASAAAPTSSTIGAAEAWKKMMDGLRVKRPRMAALLAHAELGHAAEGTIGLVFEDAYAVEQAEKARAEIEQALAAEWGRAVRLTLSVAGAASAGPPPLARSEVAVEADALAADRRRRESEARQHPMIRRAQDLFGVSAREIKTE